MFYIPPATSQFAAIFQSTEVMGRTDFLTLQPAVKADLVLVVAEALEMVTPIRLLLEAQVAPPGKMLVIRLVLVPVLETAAETAAESVVMAAAVKAAVAAP